ncbi:inner-membrane translocator [Candidatus Vecturithrix granuli]|uniref:Inner-membrane translocator n=1 Tax=Vecturithrix granuli TaxID=1499967 RepID=A0A081C4P6_VECG1|nr:inner-membrane translocator [Candidatus Vecturithrix granuli]
MNIFTQIKTFLLNKEHHTFWMWIYPVASIVLAFICGGLMLLLLDLNPISIYRTMLVMTFNDPYSIGEIFVKSIPLMLSALSFAFAFKAGLFNIGADGQFYMGALAAVIVSLKLSFLNPVAILLIAFVFSVIAGSLWSGISGYLKAKYNANEIIITIMLNYIAFQIVNFMVNGPIKEQIGAYPQTDPIPRHAHLPILLPRTRLHWGLLLGLLFVALFYVILMKTTLGFKIRAVGLNSNAAEYGGIHTKQVLIMTMLLTGIYAGVAGFIEINGVQHILIQGFAPNIGGEGTIIALLAYTNPIGIVIASIFFGFLKVGANIIQQTSKVPTDAITMIEGFVVIFVLISYYLQAQMMQRRSKRLIARQAHQKQGL